MRDRGLLQPQLGKPSESSMHVVAGHDSYVTLADGRSLIDLAGGYWNVAVGYGHRSILRAARHAFERLSAAHLYRRSHEPALKLARRLHEIAPAGTCDKVLFSNDGSGAAETAFRLVMRWRERVNPSSDTVIVLSGGYHGDSLVVRELGDFPTGDPRLSIGLQIARVKPSLSDEPDRHDDAIRGLHHVMQMVKPAAIFCEIVQGVSGMRALDDRYVREMSTLCDQNGALFVVDEIATGFGRTGRMFATEHSGVRPDLTLVGKGLTGGYFPLAAVLIGTRVLPLLEDEFAHGHTTSGHPVGCEIAVAVIDEILKHDLASRSATIGETVSELLHSALGSAARVRGIGLFIGIELPSTRFASEVRDELEKREIIVGQEAHVVTLVPPLNIDERRLMAAVREVAAVILRVIGEAPSSAA